MIRSGSVRVFAPRYPVDPHFDRERPRPPVIATVDTDGDGIPNDCDPSNCTGDLNNDGEVDAADLGFLIGSWNTGGADLNRDGTTHSADIALLVGLGGPCT